MRALFVLVCLIIALSVAHSEDGRFPIERERDLYDRHEILQHLFKQIRYRSYVDPSGSTGQGLL